MVVVVPTEAPPASVQLYVYGAVPPVAFTVALPLFPPKQFTSVLATIVAAGAPASFTVAFAVATQPLASVTVTVYPPAKRLVAQSVVCDDPSSHTCV